MRIFKAQNTYFLILALGLVSACSPHYKDKPGNPQLVASPDRATMMLAQAADKASTALETLAAIEQKRTPAASVAPIQNVPEELRRGMTISWVGPVEPITKTLANHSEYRFVVLGDKPPVPIVVNLEAENTRVIDLLRDVGLQLGTRGGIKVDGSRKVVELQYAPIHSGDGAGL